MKKSLLYLALGFLIGACVVDCIYLRKENEKFNRRYQYGLLIMAVMERPDHCPKCDFEFHYSFTYDDEELQQLIDDYLGKGDTYYE